MLRWIDLNVLFIGADIVLIIAADGGPRHSSLVKEINETQSR